MATPGDCDIPPPSSIQSPAGKTGLWVELPVYYSLPDKPTAAVIIATDIYGWEIPQVRMIADYLSQNGFLAVIPDLLHGDPVTDKGRPPDWRQRHEPVNEVPNVENIVKYIKNTFGVHKFGILGFCWGGKVSVVTGAAGFLDAICMMHPSMVTVEDIKALKTPVCILAAENDKMTPVSLIEEFREILMAGPESKNEVKIFPGVNHGFGVRYDPQDEQQLKAAMGAQLMAAKFFKANLTE